MKLNLDNLPEKNFFSFEEIAERWNIDVETINHFIYEKKILNLPLDISDIPFCPIEITSEDFESILAIHEIAGNIYRKKLDPSISNRADGFYYTDEPYLEVRIEEKDWVNDVELNQLVKKINREKLREKTVIADPKTGYLYKSEPIEQDSELSWNNYSDDFIVLTQDINKKYYLFFHSWSEDDFPGVSINIMIIKPRCIHIITKEERDRFEKKYSIIKNIIGEGHKAERTCKTFSSNTLEKLNNQTQLIIQKYPAWRDKVGVENIQNTQNLMEWIRLQTSSNTREAEIIKKGLIEKFPELNKR